MISLKFHEYGRKSAFRCTHHHGPMNFHSGLVQSCNIYYYNMGERVGMNRLSRYGDRIHIRIDEASRKIIAIDSSVFNLVLATD